MKESRVLIAFGANLGERERAYEFALQEIARRVGRITARSPIYATSALTLPGSPLQPDYLNAVLLVESALDPHAILFILLDIERDAGRDRTVETSRWLPRVLDLDLIGVESFVIRSSQLVLPHPELHKRRFVLEPLCDVWRDWEHPLLKKSAHDLLEALSPGLG